MRKSSTHKLALVTVLFASFASSPVALSALAADTDGDGVEDIIIRTADGSQSIIQIPG